MNTVTFDQLNKKYICLYSRLVYSIKKGQYYKCDERYMEKKQQSRKEEIIICLLYDSNEDSYINSPWGPIELHRIFLTEALKTLE